MMISEFISRTGVRVSETEFEAINEVYNKSDLLKDDFCKLWCKMNPSRVERAKAQKRAELAARTKKDFLYDMYRMIWNMTFNRRLRWTDRAAAMFNESEMSKLQNYGIDTWGTLSDVYGQIKMEVSSPELMFA